MPERPLVITSDEEMLDELLRVAAAADIEVTHLAEPGSRVSWRQAPLVLIDVAAVPRAVALALPRRPGVVAIAPAEPADVPWDDCIRLGVDRTVRLAQADEDLIELLADTAGADPGDGDLIAVVGACGGAGASVFATAVAAAADRRSRRVLLADCDRWGAGLDVVLGVENLAGVHWGTLAAPSGRLSAAALHQALPSVPVGSGRISVLCHPRAGQGHSPPDELTADIVDVVISAGRRAGDLVVADVARGVGLAQERVLERADLVVLVTTADVRGCFGGARIAARLIEMGALPELIVRGPSPGGIGADDIAEVLGLPILARMRPQPFLARDLESGRVPGADRTGPLARAAAAVLDRLDPP